MIASTIRRWFPGQAATTRSTMPTSRSIPVTVDVSGNPTHPWQPGETLMGTHNRQVMMKRINRLVGLPEAHFETLYQGLVSRFAGYVQQMPASETHHHARLGGLLDHSLDVAERALSIRRSYLLPPNRAPEVVARSADRWTYGVFLAALFHDIGKPATDLEITLYDERGSSLGVWKPAVGPMKDASRYYISFRKDRRYDQHERIASFIGRSLLSDEALGWLSSDQELISCWLASLAGDHDAAGVIGAIIAQADGQSVAADLGGSKSPRLSSSRKRPLSEMLLLALKQIFEEGQVKINRPGAEAWVTDTDLWLVSKVGSDLLREWLIGKGVGAVPKNNNRVFDELQQHKICRSTPAYKAIWSVRVKAGDFDERLTMLRFPIETVWPDADHRPAPLKGEIIVGDTDASATTKGEAVGKDSITKPDVAAGGEVLAFPSPEGDDFARNDDADELSTLAIPHDPGEAGQPPSTAATASVGSGRINWGDKVEELFRWLAAGISDRWLTINVDRQDGNLWVVKEGLFIRTPGALRRFSDEHGIEDDVSVRKALERQDELLMNSRPKPTVTVYYEMMVDGRTEKMKGVVLLKPEKCLKIRLPGACRFLTRARCPNGFF